MVHAEVRMFYMFRDGKSPVCVSQIDALGWKKAPLAKIAVVCVDTLSPTIAGSLGAPRARSEEPCCTCG